MGRMLSISEYGLFITIMAFFALLSSPLGALLMVVSRKVSEYFAVGDDGNISHFFISINICSLTVSAFVLLIFLIFSPYIQSYLKAPNISPVYLLGIILSISCLPIINNAFLQGLQHFNWLAVSSLFGVVLRVVLALILVSMGFGVSGAIGGIILGVLLGWGFTLVVLYPLIQKGKEKKFKKTHLTFKPAFPVLIASIAFASMTQLDVVMVNFYFPEEIAGQYAAASILGKTVLMLSGGIVMVLFPMVAAGHARGGRGEYLLTQALVLTALLCSAGAIFYYFFGAGIIDVLFGEQYREAGNVLKYYGIAILPMSFMYVMENFLIAKGKTFLAYLFLLSAPLQLVAIHNFHQSLYSVLLVIGLNGLILVLLGCAFLMRSKYFQENINLDIIG